MKRLMDRRITESDARFRIDELFRAAGIVIASRLSGWLGRLHPEIEEELKFRQPVFVADVGLGSPRATAPQAL